MEKRPGGGRLILASGSPYRAGLLARLGLDFDRETPGIDETPAGGEPAGPLAERLALAKARAVSARHPDAIVIGSDQVAVCRERLLGKPGDRQGAIEQLTWCQGDVVTFHTALAVCSGVLERCASVPTRVRLKPLEPARIERYVDAEQPYDCAGAMKSEALGISLAEAITSDDPTALIGLPLIRLVALLEDFGLSIP